MPPSLEQNVPGVMSSLGDGGCDRGDDGEGARGSGNDQLAEGSGSGPPPRRR
jgi:hypothetical protein